MVFQAKQIVVSADEHVSLGRYRRGQDHIVIRIPADGCGQRPRFDEGGAAAVFLQQGDLDGLDAEFPAQGEGQFSGSGSLVQSS